MMRSIKMAFALCALILGPTSNGRVVAQEHAASPPAVRFAALEAINASYQQQQHDLECRQIADLAALAQKSSGPEADAALRQLFTLAIGRKLCPQAQDAAQRRLSVAKSSPEVCAMAALVQVLRGPTRENMTWPSATSRSSSGAPPPAGVTAGRKTPSSRWPSARRSCAPGPRRPVRYRPQVVRCGMR